MDRYSIVFEAPEKVAFKKSEVLDPKDGEVQLRALYSLISAGTEKAHLKGEKNSPHKYPNSIGYSTVGIVTKVGKNIKSFKEGDRVFATYGGHRNIQNVTYRNVFPVPDNVDDLSAVFVKMASFPLMAIRRSGMVLGESLVIVGTGMLGLFGVQIGHLSGACPLICVGGARQDRLEKAKLYGADYVFTASDPELAKKINEITDAHTFYKGANVIIETSGTEDAIHSALKYTSKNARLVLNGCNRVIEKPIDFYPLVHRKGVSIIGAHNSNRPPDNSAPNNWTAKRDYKLLFEYMADGRLNPKDMIGEIVSPNDCVQVYDRLLHDPDFPLGVIFDWEHFHG